jgi:hypothetical protein
MPHAPPTAADQRVGHSGNNQGIFAANSTWIGGCGKSPESKSSLGENEKWTLTSAVQSSGLGFSETMLPTT